MMLRLLVILLLLTTPLCAAEYESNFGRVILANCDVILQGVASATREKVGTSTKVQVTVATVLHGNEPKQEIVVYYPDPAALNKEEAVRALFALKRLGSGSYNLVGKPVLTPESDAEEADKLRVAKDFIALETQPADAERTTDFWNLLLDHLQLGGYSAQNAAVELMFIAQKRGGIITEARFDSVIKTRDAAKNRLTQQTRDDLDLACQGLVEANVKSLKFKRVRRGESRTDKRKAADELLALHDDFGRAFTDEDAKLCDALVDADDDTILQDKVRKIARAIRASLKLRAEAERIKEAEARKKIEHAGG